MFLGPYATVIVGAMPTKLTASTAGVTVTVVLFTMGATPTKLTAPTTPLMVFANTIFKTPPSLYTVPVL